MTKILISDAAYEATSDNFLFDQHIRLHQLSLNGSLDFTRNELWQVWQKAYHFSRSWYFDESGKDLTLINELSAGSIVEIDFWYQIRHVLERLLLLKRIKEAFNPEEIHLATFENDLLKQIVNEIGPEIKTENFSKSNYRKLKMLQDAEKRKWLLKYISLDRHSRILSLLASKTTFLKDRKKREVLGILEQPGDYLALSLLPVLQEFNSKAVLTFDRRHGSTIAKHDIAELSILPFLLPQLFKHKSVKNDYASKWHLFKKSISESFVCDGTNLWPLAEVFIRNLYLRKFPFLHLEAMAAKELMAYYDVSALVTMTDAHYSGRLFCSVGNQMGIDSLVIQHGVTAGEWGYLPVFASKFAAWGDASRRWLEKRGVPSHKIEVTGQPRFDQITKYRNERLHKENRGILCAQYQISESHFLVLWIMDPLPQVENYKIIKNLKDLLALTKVTILIRPHPGISQLDWLCKTTANEENMIIVDTKSSIHELISSVDTVVIQESTVGLEAMAMGKNTIILLSDRVKVGEPFNEAPIDKVYSSDELIHAIAQARVQKKSITSTYETDRHKEFLFDYLYKLDGKSSQRVANIVKSLAVNSEKADCSNVNQV